MINNSETWEKLQVLIKIETMERDEIMKIKIPNSAMLQQVISTTGGWKLKKNTSFQK